MPWIKSKSRDENVTFIEAATAEEITEKFEEFLEGQRQQGRTVTESEAFPGEWDVSDQDGFIAIYYLDCILLLGISLNDYVRPTDYCRGLVVEKA